MKNFKYYEDKAKKELYEEIKRKLEVEKQPLVRLSVDYSVKSIAELDKTASQHVMKRIWRKTAQSEMKKAKISSLWMIQPVPGAEFNGIKLDEGIVLPVFAPSVLDNNKLTENHFLMGLFLVLQKKFDKYYVKLLRSFDLDKSIVVPELLEMLESDKYWKKRKIYKEK